MSRNFNPVALSGSADSATGTREVWVPRASPESPPVLHQCNLQRIAALLRHPAIGSEASAACPREAPCWVEVNGAAR